MSQNDINQNPNLPVFSIIVVCFPIAAATRAEGFPIAAPGAKVLLEFSLRFGPGKGHSVGGLD